MGCFRINLASPMELIFYALSLAQAYRAVQLAGRLRQDWSGFRQPPLTRQKMHLVEQSAFLLAIPPSVIVHEFFHVIPIWLFGGRIASCGYGFYWGYVQADRLFPATEQWMISLGGTIGSLLFAVILFGLLAGNKSPSLRYFGRQSLKNLLYFSLIYYPIFTVLTFIGDWRIIYDFRVTPVLSGATAVFHILLLLLFWQGNRRGWFEMVGHKDQKGAEAFAQLEAKWRQNPQDAQLAMQYTDCLLAGGAPQKAATVVRQAIGQNPNAAPLYVQLGIIEHGGKGKIPGTAVRNLEKALQLGLSDAHQKAVAHYLLAQAQLDKGNGQGALDHLNEAFSIVEAEEKTNAIFKAKLHQLRSLAYQRLNQPDQALQDAQQAVELANTTGNERAVAYYQSKLEMIQNWNGRSR